LSWQDLWLAFRVSFWEFIEKIYCLAEQIWRGGFEKILGIKKPGFTIHIVEPGNLLIVTAKASKRDLPAAGQQFHSTLLYCDSS
jgi:hypothetical protein